MNPLILGCYLLLAVASPPHAASAAPTVLMSPLEKTPEAAFMSLTNDVAALLRRVLAEPNDAKALALLQGPEAAHLLQREEKQKPALRKWIKALPLDERKAFGQRIVDSDLIQFLQSIDKNAQVNARLKQNPKLEDAIRRLAIGIL